MTDNWCLETSLTEREHLQPQKGGCWTKKSSKGKRQHSNDREDACTEILQKIFNCDIFKETIVVQVLQHFNDWIPAPLWHLILKPL